MKISKTLYHFLLFVTFQTAQSLFFIPPGFSNTLANFLKVPPELLFKISPKCALETGIFMNSLLRASKVLETCDRQDCQEKLKDDVFSLKQLDAFGKIPSGISQWTTVSDGSYQSCWEVDGLRYLTNYCYLTLIPGKNSTCPDFDDLSSDMTDPRNVIFKLAICIPKSCSSKDTVKIFNTVSQIAMTACQTHCIKRDHAYSIFWFYLFLIFMATVILFTIAGTALDYFMVDEDVKDFRFRFLSCFSLYSNIKKILSTKDSESRLKSIDFLKFWSVVWVIIGHSPANFLMGDSVKGLVEDRKKLMSHLMFDAAYSVETFFVVTGTLLGYGLWKNSTCSQLIRSRTFWLKILARRYIRLVPPLIIFTWLFMFSAPYIRGPTMISMFDNLEKQAEKCSSSWWRNIFMLQNFYKPKDNCYMISWYIAADFQLLLMAPLLVIPWMKSQNLGLKSSFLLISLSILSTFAIFCNYSIPPFNYSLRGMEEYLTYVHQSSFLRTPTFLAGILLGKVLATQNRPVDLLKENRGKIWLLCFLAIFWCFYGKSLAVSDFGEPEMSSFSSAAHHIFHRTLWTLVIIWVIYSCQFELARFFTSFINHPIWQPFGRLTYCIYIVHWWMLYVVMNQGDRSLHFVSQNQVLLTISIPTVILCIPMALIWSTLFEVPVSRYYCSLGRDDLGFQNSATASRPPPL